MKKLIIFCAALLFSFGCNGEGDLPEVETSAVSVQGNTVTSGGIVHSEGATGGQVHRRGVVWLEDGTRRPTIDRNIGRTSDGVGPGEFTSTFEVDESGTYQLRAYATNQRGTTYGAVEKFEID